MTAREKLQGLTNSWLGYMVFTAALSLVREGRSIIGTAIGLLCSLALVWFIGNRLMAKSSLTRFVLLVVSTLTTVFGAFGVARSGWLFLHDFSLSLLLAMFFGAVSVGMHVKSLRVLTDDSVKSYFN
jgi:hypothetical protein